jgi:hypothetical protein
MGCCQNKAHDLVNLHIGEISEIVQYQLEDHPLLIYSYTTDQTSIETKEYLRQNGIGFESFDLNNIPEGDEIHKRLK